jgi:hypothetical protein
MQSAATAGGSREASAGMAPSWFDRVDHGVSWILSQAQDGARPLVRATFVRYFGPYAVRAARRTARAPRSLIFACLCRSTVGFDGRGRPRPKAT